MWRGTKDGEGEEGGEGRERERKEGRNIQRVLSRWGGRGGEGGRKGERCCSYDGNIPMHTNSMKCVLHYSDRRSD